MRSGLVAWMCMCALCVKTIRVLYLSHKTNEAWDRRIVAERVSVSNYTATSKHRAANARCWSSLHQIESSHFFCFLFWFFLEFLFCFVFGIVPHLLSIFRGEKLANFNVFFHRKFGNLETFLFSEVHKLRLSITVNTFEQQKFLFWVHHFDSI